MEAGNHDADNLNANADKKGSRRVSLHPEVTLTRPSIEYPTQAGFVRTIRVGRSGGSAFLVRGAEQSHFARRTLSASRDLDDDPVHRLSALSEGECFEINGIHYENQLYDLVLQNHNTNFYEDREAPPPTVREIKIGDGYMRFIKYGSGGDDELEEGGEWMTAVQADNGEWTWVPSKETGGRSQSRVDGRAMDRRAMDGGASGGRSEGQLAATSVGHTAGTSAGPAGQLAGTSVGQLVGSTSIDRSEVERGPSPTRSDLVSRTTLPGYRSGMAIAMSRQRNNGDGGETWWMIVKEPYSSWKRRRNVPSTNRDKDIDTCLLCSFCILFLALIGGVVYLCISASSPRKATVYSVDSIVIPEEKAEGKEKEGVREAGGTARDEGKTNEGDDDDEVESPKAASSRISATTTTTTTTTTSKKAATKPLDSEVRFIEEKLENQRRAVDSLSERLRQTNETLRQLMKRSEERRTNRWASLASVESTLVKTALAGVFCELATISKARLTDDANFSAAPKYENCEKNITIEASTKPSGFADETFVGVGGECEIVCDEKAGFFLLKEVAPTVYADAPTRVRCSYPSKFDENDTNNNNNDSSGSFGGAVVVVVETSRQRHAVWTIPAKENGDATPLVDSNTPLCYRRHCPKSQLDSGANFKCVTQTGPGAAQVVVEGDSCSFLGCSQGTHRVLGTKNSVFTCGSDGRFHLQPMVSSSVPPTRRSVRLRQKGQGNGTSDGFPQCVKLVPAKEDAMADQVAAVTATALPTPSKNAHTSRNASDPSPTSWKGPGVASTMVAPSPTRSQTKEEVSTEKGALEEASGVKGKAATESTSNATAEAANATVRKTDMAATEEVQSQITTKMAGSSADDAAAKAETETAAAKATKTEKSGESNATEEAEDAAETAETDNIEEGANANEGMEEEVVHDINNPKMEEERRTEKAANTEDSVGRKEPMRGANASKVTEAERTNETNAMQAGNDGNEKVADQQRRDDDQAVEEETAKAANTTTTTTMTTAEVYAYDTDAVETLDVGEKEVTDEPSKDDDDEAVGASMATETVNKEKQWVADEQSGDDGKTAEGEKEKAADASTGTERENTDGTNATEAVKGRKEGTNASAMANGNETEAMEADDDEEEAEKLDEARRSVAKKAADPSEDENHGSTVELSSNVNAFNDDGPNVRANWRALLQKAGTKLFNASKVYAEENDAGSIGDSRRDFSETVVDRNVTRDSDVGGSQTVAYRSDSLRGEGRAEGTNVVHVETPATTNTAMKLADAANQGRSSPIDQTESSSSSSSTTSSFHEESSTQRGNAF